MPHDRENAGSLLTGTATIERAAEEWSYPEMEKDLEERRPIWREVSADFYDQALNVLPPMDWTAAGFLVMEPQTHDRRGAVHAMFSRVTQGGRARFFARYVHRRDMIAARVELGDALVKIANGAQA